MYKFENFYAQKHYSRSGILSESDQRDHLLYGDGQKDGVSVDRDS